MHVTDTEHGHEIHVGGYPVVLGYGADSTLRTLPQELFTHVMDQFVETYDETRGTGSKLQTLVRLTVVPPLVATTKKPTCSEGG